MTPWHPAHIAERYGLFTIIVLGECVAAVAVAVQTSLASGGATGNLVVTGLAVLHHDVGDLCGGAAGGGLVADCGVGSVIVVVDEPAGEVVPALRF